MSVLCFPEFFVKHSVAVMTVRELFDFITDPSITCNNIDQYLDKVWTLHMTEKSFIHKEAHKTG